MKYLSSTATREIDLIADVAAVRSGDEQALAQLIDRTRNLVTCIALSIVKDIDQAEDIAQKVYITIWQKIHTLKNDASFLPWLRQTTRNIAFNFLRDNKVTRHVDHDEAERLLEAFSDPSQDLDTTMQRDQQSVILNDFINSLPEKSREVILLYYREEKSAQQVAQLLGLTEANVRQRLSRSRKNLQENIIEKYGRLILSTAPTALFSSAVLSSFIATPPVAAATLISAATTKPMPWFLKLLTFLGGAILGAVTAAFAIMIGSKIQRRGIKDIETQDKLLQNRNQTVGFVLVFGFMFMLSYEFTQGWWGPVLAYSLFVLGMLYFSIENRKIINHYHATKAESDDINQHKNRFYNKLCNSYIGFVIGFGTGYIGLIYGLINSGRL